VSIHLFLAPSQRQVLSKAIHVVCVAHVHVKGNKCDQYIYYCTSGRAVQENIRFKAGSIGPTVGLIVHRSRKLNVLLYCPT